MTEQTLAARVALILAIAMFGAVHGPHAMVRAQEPGKDVKGDRDKKPAAPTHQAVYAQEYYHSFKGDRELGPEFHWHGLEPQACVEFEVQGLRINLPEGHEGKRMGTGIGINTTVKGDFEITLRYELLKEPTATAASTGLFIWVDLHKPKLNRAFISRVTRDGNQFVTWYHLTREPPEKAIDVLWPYPAKESSGRLRLVRTGAVLYYYVAEGADGNFKLLQQHAFGTDDLQAIRWGGQTGGAKASLEGRFLDLRIRADSLPELPDVVNTNQKAPPAKTAALAPAKTGSSPGWLAAALGIGVTFLLLCALGIAVILRRGRAAPTIDSKTEDALEPTVATVAFPCPECGKGIKVRATLTAKK